MDNDLLIDKLQEKIIKNYLDIAFDRELLLNNQINFNEVFVGVNLNEVLEKNIYELYFYVKTVNKIACPFKYNLIKDENDARTEYIKNKNFIENTDLDEIIKSFI